MLSPGDIPYFFPEHRKTLSKVFDLGAGYKNDEYSEKYIKKLIYKIKLEAINSAYLTMKRIDEKKAVFEKNEKLKKASTLLQ